MPQHLLLAGPDTRLHPCLPAAVVGNAQPELVQWVLEQPQERRLVVTDAPMARGILEGLARHGLY